MVEHEQVITEQQEATKALQINNNNRKHSFSMNRKTGAMIFYVAMMALPILQFVIMYICVNINSILLAFKVYDVNSGLYIYQGFGNFIEAFEEIAQPEFLTAIKNSLILFLFTAGINLPLSIIFSYYIYKKFLAHKFFRIALYLPCIISSVVMVTIYLYLMERAVPEILLLLTGEKTEGLISRPDTAMGALLLYSVFFSFGSITMIIASSMSGINTSVIEAATLDGCNLFQEFFYIVFPLSFNVIKLQLIAALVGVFTNQMNLYTFFGLQASPRLYTLGYYLYQGILWHGRPEYPFYAAMGICFSCIAIPIIFAFRAWFDRMDPAVEKKAKRGGV